MKVIASSRSETGMMSSDGFHLNGRSYRCVAEHIATAILSRLSAMR
jgi:lysophospholipase L1-like esterase